MTVLGAVMLAFGALGMLTVPMAVAARFLGTHGSSRVDHLLWTGRLGVWTMSSIGLRTLLTLLLAASGLGVLGRRRWAIKTAIVYGIGAIALSIAVQLFNIVFFYPRLFELLQTGNVAERGGAIGGLFGGIIGGLFGMILPIAILIVVTRPAIRRELGG